MRRLVVLLSLVLVPACGDGGGGPATADADVSVEDADGVGGDVALDVVPDEGADVTPDLPPDDGGPGDVPPEVDAVDAAPDDGGPEVEDVEPDAPDGDVGPGDVPDVDEVDAGPECGDGEVEGDEACDDGEDNSDTAPDACRTDCTLPTCGDGVKDGDEACDDGDLDDTDACTSECAAGPDLAAPGAAGALVLTEIMVNPVSAEDPTGEWIEVHNPGADALSLVGCALRDDGTDLVALGEEGGGASVPAGGYLVLGFSDDPEANGGAPVDVAYGGMLLDNVADEVVLECGDVIVDAVAWSAGDWPLEAGAALALDQGVDAAGNDLPEAWCSAQEPYGDGDLGTPGAANPPCPVPDVDVDVCRLVADATAELYTGQSAAFTVEVEEAGLTDATDGVDMAPGLRVQVGHGPENTVANDAWAWETTAPVAGWSSEGGVDAWEASVAFPVTGDFAVVGRVSLDDGATWTLCDRDAGSADGYQPDLATFLAVHSNPCSSVTCDTPPAPECDADGVTVLTFAAPGGCEIVAHDAVCHYPATETDCADAGQVCTEDVTCGGAATSPTDSGQVVVTEVMVLPEAGFGVSGQWLELYNAGDAPVNLAGCVLGYDDQAHEVASDLVVGAGRYAVLARSGSQPLNGGIEPDYVYGEDLLLAQAGATLTVTCGDTTQDQVAWNGGSWPLEEGATLSLSPYVSDAGANDAASAWCAGAEPFGFGDLGTPGARNSACPDDEDAVDACELQQDFQLPPFAGTPVGFEARLVEAGVTDLTTHTDTSDDLLVEVGFRTPEIPWTWTGAMPDELWDAASAEAPLDQDAWDGVLTTPAPGTFEVLFRVSADAGNTWQLCGVDGLGTEEAPPEPIVMQSLSGPCYPSPCVEDPGPACDGDVVVSRQPPSTCSVTDDEATCSWEETPQQDCAALGGVCEAGACTGLPPQPAPGELIFTEILVAPHGGELGEWVELRSLADGPRDLAGCLLESGAESWTVHHEDPAALFVAPDQRLVLARSEAPEGATADLVYGSGVALANTADEVRLTCDGALLDVVAWDVTVGWSVTKGRALSLSAAWSEAASNDAPEAWCLAAVEAGVGTPGEPNGVCPPADDTIDACWLEGPANLAVDAGEAVEVGGLVQDAWTTDATDGTDVAPGLVAQVGWGPTGADPADPTSGFAWSDAAPDTGWQDTSPGGDRDRWAGTVVPDAVGSQRLVARFSADAGATWTVCDLDGSANGFDPAQAGKMFVNATACIPNPCTAPPGVACDGDLLTVGAGEGTCAAPAEGGGEPTCDYPLDTFDCADWGGCVDGACVEPVPAPAAAGDVVFTEVMRDSLMPAPDLGEWVEVHNDTTGTLDLRGCTLHDLDGESHLVDGPLPVAVLAGNAIVLAASGDSADLGGFVPDYVWAGVTLGNVFDEVVLTCGDVVVDEVAWSVDWPGSEGVAMHAVVLDEVDNDDPAAWCAAQEPYGDGSQLGTPGFADHECPAP